MKRFLPLLMLVASSCGVPSVSQTTDSTQEALSAEKERIASQLLWCENVPSKNRPNTLTSRPDCDTGDSIFAAGINFFAEANPRLQQGILDSIGVDGRPYRSPEHRRVYESGFEDGKSFSRDHMLGLLFYVLAAHDLDTLNRIWGWAKGHALQICVGDMAQCQLTPALLDLIGDVYQSLGEPRPGVSRIPGFLLEAEARQEALSNSGYRLALVADKILLKAVAGRMTSAYADTVQIVAERQPENLYFRFIANYVKGNDPKIYRDIEERLLEKMRGWPGLRIEAWAWTAAEYEKAMGWDYVFLARMLQRVRGEES